MRIKNTFLQGIMNKDIDERLLPEGQYPHAENIRVANSESSDVGAIENMLGNRVLSSFDLGTNPSTVFVLSDSFTNNIYWGVVSDSGSYVLEHNTDTETSTFVLQDERVGDANVLGFSSDFLITDPRILIDSDNNRRFLFLTDNNTFVKQINIERAKTYGLNGFTEEDIALIKKPPLNPPTIALESVDESLTNNIEEKFLIFAYRYKYLDEERSALSPFSEVAFRVGTFNYDFSINTNDSMVNAFNKVVITLNTGSSLVTGIDVIFKEINSANAFLVGSFDKSDRGWADNTDVTVDFTNDKSARALDANQLTRLFDNVPRKAKGLELIGNRLILGNYTENYNLVDDEGDAVVPDLTLTSTQTAIPTNTGSTTVKSIRDYEVVIAYGDEYGRLTTALESENNSHHIGGDKSTMQNKLQVTVASNPPAFASFYRFFVKQSRRDYDVITPTLFYQDGTFVWLKIENSDVSKIAENDVVYVKADTRGLLDEVREVKILEITPQPRNFLETQDLETLEQVAGTYAKIKPVGFNLNEADLDNYEWEATFSNTGFENYIGTNVNYIQPPIYYGIGGGLDDLTSSGTYTNNADLRYLVEIDGTQTAASGTVTLNTGTSGSVDSITVNGVEIMSGSVAFDTDLATTATAVAANITSNTSSPNYTATASGTVITITAVELGTASNGFAVVSTATDITTTDVNLAGGSNNTFRWSIDNGATFGGEDIAITAGTPQALSNGVMVTFGADVGHVTTDRWFIGAKSAQDDSLGVDEDSYFYAIYKGNDVDVIRAGARINFIYDEYGDETQYVEKNYIASTGYENLEEWFIGDNIQDDIGIPANRIWFRRGTVSNISVTTPFQQLGGQQLNITDDGTGTMNMVIRSLGFENSNFDDTARARVSLEIIQSDNTILLETKPVELEDEFYYEISRTYPVVNGYHVSNEAGDVDQTSTQDAVITLPFFNAYAWGNGFESIKIKDLFNANSINITTRALASIEDYRENIRIASLTYSQPYEQTTNFNGINEFNTARLNFKDMDDAYGTIQKLWSRDTDLLVFQEDKTHKVLFQKSVLFNADGTGNVSQNSNVLGQEVPYLGEYGISKNPESFAIYGNYIWHTDTRRGCVLQLTNNGYHEISDNGMRDYFRDYFRNNLTANNFGMYDPYHDQYVVHTRGDNATLSYDARVKGFTSFHSYIPDGMTNLNNRFYTVKDGQLYLHNDETVARNTYYGVAYPSRISVLVNQDPSTIKELHAVSLEGSEPWEIDLRSYITTVGDYKQSSLTTTNFEEKEGLWFAYARRNERTNYESKAAYGVGVVTAINGSVVTINGGSALLTTNDNIFTQAIVEIGSITAIEVVGSTVNLTLSSVTGLSVGDYVFGMKDNRIEGGNLRGYTLRYDMTNNTTDNAVELFAVNSEVKKSYTS